MWYICQGRGRQPPANVSYQEESAWFRLMHERTFVRAHSVACCTTPITLLCQFPGLRTQGRSPQKCSFPSSFINWLMQSVSVVLGVTHQTSSGLPRQQPSPIPCQHFATCHSLPLFMIRNRCWRVYCAVWTQISYPECVCLCLCVLSWASDSWRRGLYLWRNSMAAERRGDPEGGLMVPLLPAQR